MGKIAFNKSFYDWCIENNRNDLLELWDYSMNSVTPKDIGYSSNSKYYFKCPRGLHESEQKIIYSLIKQSEYKCSKCQSIGQYIIDKYGEEYLHSKWSSNNIISPFEISSGSSKKVWIRCTEKDYHPDYLQSVSSFRKGCKCPYCSNKKVVKEDSLGAKYPQVLDIWSEKNDISPYEVTHGSMIEVYWKCENNKHQDYKRAIGHSTTYNFKCPFCAKENQKTPLIDLTNRIFGYLKVLEIDNEKSKTGKVYWKCSCRCGREKSILGTHLRRGLIKSCGCLHREKLSGVDHWDWSKEPPSVELNRIRKSNEYSLWREKVFERDNHTCQCCGSTSNLNAHHLNNFLDYPEERLLIENGITLCEKCHLSKYEGSFHNIYGTMHTTKKDFESYLNEKLKIKRKECLNEHHQS